MFSRFSGLLLTAAAMSAFVGCEAYIDDEPDAGPPTVIDDEPDVDINEAPDVDIQEAPDVDVHEPPDINVQEQPDININPPQPEGNEGAVGNEPEQNPPSSNNSPPGSNN